MNRSKSGVWLSRRKTLSILPCPLFRSRCLASYQTNKCLGRGISYSTYCRAVGSIWYSSFLPSVMTSIGRARESPLNVSDSLRLLSPCRHSIRVVIRPPPCGPRKVIFVTVLVSAIRVIADTNKASETPHRVRILLPCPVVQPVGSP